MAFLQFPEEWYLERQARREEQLREWRESAIEISAKEYDDIPIVSASLVPLHILGEAKIDKKGAIIAIKCGESAYRRS